MLWHHICLRDIHNPPGCDLVQSAVGGPALAGHVGLDVSGRPF